MLTGYALSASDMRVICPSQLSVSVRSCRPGVIGSIGRTQQYSAALPSRAGTRPSVQGERQSYTQNGARRIAYGGHWSGLMTIAPPCSTPSPVLYSTGTARISYTSSSNCASLIDICTSRVASTIICSERISLAAHANSRRAGNSPSGESGNRNTSWAVASPLTCIPPIRLILRRQPAPRLMAISYHILEKIAIPNQRYMARLRSAGRNRVHTR